MQKLHRLLQGNWRDVVFGSIALIVVIADQFTKSWIRTNLAMGEVLVDKGFVQIVHVQNTGASFGIFKGHTPIIIAAVFLEMILILSIVYLFRSRLSFLDSMLMRVGAGLIFGGAIGNQVDRLLLGHVTDFIDFKVWPAFNVADASAVVGVIIVAYCIIFLSGLGKRKA
jgi:signal peptidase II